MNIFGKCNRRVCAYAQKCQWYGGVSVECAARMASSGAEGRKKFLQMCDHYLDVNGVYYSGFPCRLRAGMKQMIEFKRYANETTNS